MQKPESTLTVSRTMPSVHTLVDVLFQRAQQQPDSLAFSFLVNGETENKESGAIEWTYKMLYERTVAISSLLRLHARPGTRVLLSFDPGLENISAFLGCLCAGVIAVPAQPPRRKRTSTLLNKILADCGAEIALTTTSCFSSVESQLQMHPELAAIRWLTVDDLPVDWGVTAAVPTIENDSIAFLQYTSGSTGDPKGVMVSHGNLFENLTAIRNGFQLGPQETAVTWLPMYHDMGLIGGILESLFVGGKSFIMSPLVFGQNPFKWLKAISKFQATISGGPNFAYQLCIDKIRPEQRLELDLSSWKLAFCGAEPVCEDTLNRFAATFSPCGFRPESFYPCYGMAESTLLISGGQGPSLPSILRLQSQPLRENRVQLASNGDVPTQSFVSCGSALANQRIVIVDPESKETCTEDQIGEIWTFGASVAQGYWNCPKLTHETFENTLRDSGDDPFLRTGDLGFLHDDQLYVTGRLKDLIVIRGKNHYSQDIERSAVGCSSVLRSAGTAAFPVRIKGQERLVIVQEIERGTANLDVNSIASKICARVVENHELVPYAIVLVKAYSIPRTSSGKIKRRACRDEFENDRLKLIELWSPGEHDTSERQSANNDSNDGGPQVAQGDNADHAAIEKWLVDRLADKTGMLAEAVDVRKPLALYGVDSLAALEISVDLSHWLGRDVASDILLHYPTIESLGRHFSGFQGETNGRSTGTRNGSQTPGDLTKKPVATEFPDELEFQTITGSDANGKSESGRETLGKSAPDRSKLTRSTNIYVESLGVYLPPRTVTTEEVLSSCVNNIAVPLEMITGIQSRRMAGRDEFSFDLARKSMEKCLSLSRIDQEEIDLLVCCSISRHDGPGRMSYEPGTAIKLKKHFGLEQALAFDVNNACAGMFTAIKIAQAYLANGSIRCAMVVSGEYITHLTETAQKEIEGIDDPRLACLTLGDAGAALLLKNTIDTKTGFHDIDLYTLGRHSDLCVGKATDRDHGGAIMYTQSSKLASIAIRHSISHCSMVCEKNEWSLETPHHIIMHQTSESSIEGAIHAMELISSDRKITRSIRANSIKNLKQRGNTASTSHFVALWDEILNGRINSNDHVMFPVSASGQTVGTALYTLDDLPDRVRAFSDNGIHAVSTRTSGIRIPQHGSITGRTRIESVGVIPNHPGTSCNDVVEMATAAARNCLQNSEYQASEIDLLIYAGVYRNDYLTEPAVAAILAGQLGMNSDVDPESRRKTLAFDVMNSSMGVLNAVDMATQMIAGGDFQRIMVVAAEIENNKTSRMGDLRGLKETASAIILDQKEKGGEGFGRISCCYETRWMDAFRSEARLVNGKPYLAFGRDPRLENMYVECITRAVAEFLANEPSDAAIPDVILPPQISPRFVSMLEEAIAQPNQTVINIAEPDADLFTSSLANTFHAAISQKFVKPGFVGLVIEVSPGIQVGCSKYYF